MVGVYIRNVLFLWERLTLARVMLVAIAERVEAQNVDIIALMPLRQISAQVASTWASYKSIMWTFWSRLKTP